MAWSGKSDFKMFKLQIIWTRKIEAANLLIFFFCFALELIIKKTNMITYAGNVPRLFLTSAFVRDIVSKLHRFWFTVPVPQKATRLWQTQSWTFYHWPHTLPMARSPWIICQHCEPSVKLNSVASSQKLNAGKFLNKKEDCLGFDLCCKAILKSWITLRIRILALVAVI